MWRSVVFGRLVRFGRGIGGELPVTVDGVVIARITMEEEARWSGTRRYRTAAYCVDFVLVDGDALPRVRFDVADSSPAYALARAKQHVRTTVETNREIIARRVAAGTTRRDDDG